jgi:hypothetical protein
MAMSALTAALLAGGLLLAPGYLLGHRAAVGQRRAQCAVSAEGVPLALAPTENAYALSAQIAYRLPRGPLNCRYRAELRGPAGYVWRHPFALVEADVTRGVMCLREVAVGRFSVPTRGLYRLYVEPLPGSDPRAHVQSVELHSHLPVPNLAPVVSGNLLLLLAMISLLWG